MIWGEKHPIFGNIHMFFNETWKLHWTNEHSQLFLTVVQPPWGEKNNWKKQADFTGWPPGFKRQNQSKLDGTAPLHSDIELKNIDIILSWIYIFICIPCMNIYIYINKYEYCRVANLPNLVSSYTTSTIISPRVEGQFFHHLNPSWIGP